MGCMSPALVKRLPKDKDDALWAEHTHTMGGLGLQAEIGFVRD